MSSSSFNVMRRTWLELIGRPDLITTKTKSACHFVCSLHFDKSMIKYVPQLKPDAVPTKSLLDQPSTSNLNTKDCKNVSTVTSKGDKKSSCVQATSDKASDNNSQTTQELSSDAPRRRKLRVEHKETEQKRRKLQHVLNRIKKQAQSKESEC